MGGRGSGQHDDHYCKYQVAEVRDGEGWPVYVTTQRAGESFVEMAWSCRNLVDSPLMRWLRTLDTPPRTRVLREYRPLIDQETWEKVQVKAAALHEKYRAPTTAPRTAELWLRGLVVCGWCGKPMRAYVGSKHNCQPPGHSCAGYMQHGKRNPHGCKQHHVPHDPLERLVLDYLTTTAPEVKALLDSFAGLSPKVKDRANRRGEALQEEIGALERDLCDLGITWDRIKEDLRQRKAALDQAVSRLNQEGRHRQKAEAVRTVVDRIVCHFQAHGNRHELSSIEIAASEDGAIRPLTFPEVTLQSDVRPFALS